MDLRRHAAAVSLAILAALAGCKSPQERLLDRRRDQRATLDRLYSEFRESEAEAKKEEAGAAGIVGRLLGEVDRSYFEQQCMAVGRGERPLALSAKLEEFLQRADVQSDCRRSADLQLEIDALQKDTSG